MLKKVSYRCVRLPCPNPRRPEEERERVGVLISGKPFDEDDWLWLYKTMDRLTFKMDDPIIVVMDDKGIPTYFVQRWAYQNFHVVKVCHGDRADFGSIITRLLVFTCGVYVTTFVDGVIKECRSQGIKVKIVDTLEEEA